MLCKHEVVLKSVCFRVSDMATQYVDHQSSPKRSLRISALRHAHGCLKELPTFLLHISAASFFSYDFVAELLVAN